MNHTFAITLEVAPAGTSNDILLQALESAGLLDSLQFIYPAGCLTLEIPCNESEDSRVREELLNEIRTKLPAAQVVA